MFRVSIHIENESTVVLFFKKIHGVFCLFWGNWEECRKFSYAFDIQKRSFQYLCYFQFHHIMRVKSFSFLYSSENCVHFASLLLPRGKSFNGVF